MRERQRKVLMVDTPMESSSSTSKRDYILPNVNLNSQTVSLLSLSNDLS
jgi:hypothetical protein